MKLLLCLLACLAAAQAQNCPEEGLAYFRDDSQCDRYYQCKHGVLTEELCPDGLLFNDQLQDTRYPCMYPTEVDCGDRNRRQEPQPTDKCGHQWGYFGSGNPADCGYFYNCVNGVAFQVTCPAGLAFSSASYRCEWPDESPDCDAAAFLGFSCPEQGNSIAELLRGHPHYSSPRDCREFFICVAGSPRLQYCQLGLVFNQEDRTCVDPELVRGCENYYPPEELELYRELREKAKLAQERRQAELQELREVLAERRRRQQ